MCNLEYYNTNSYAQLISKDTKALLCLQTSYAATRIDKKEKKRKKDRKKGEIKISQ
jgi:hypothetical protein